MNQTLFIIGNGFDMFHGIPSGYSDFKEFVKETDKKLFQALEYYFDADSLWSDFEGTLAYLDTDKIIDDASQFLVGYGAEDWSDAYHHDYQYEVQQAIDVVTIQLQEEFIRWILGLQIPYIKEMTLPESAQFINFNYTKTLEQIYNIPYNHILYIHNKAIDMESVLILGHGRTPHVKQQTPPKVIDNSEDNENDYYDYYEDMDDVRVTEGDKILDQYFVDTYKNTDTIINENLAFFSSLSNITKVFVLGHSMSEVDMKYFHKIKESVSSNAEWIVSYRNENQIDERREILSNLGINLMRFIKLEELK
ncbi:bacteriophage abortive infection AbiH family protein [Chryseobacterium sp. Leaf201]|uniref:bacteriophage abortive infection AbiH family protein n=1 Tax=Chryseobacterium sp. Leaf201 TaxID=1735672 RepID=UPI0006FD448F|nr:bacteriophage abortive infection AbiH family protein [Chryseobacterium sp. Leaf201]KQM19139.1 hypothetical protein ASE55_18880 [Chryseobacterium sp. Leaf201]